MVFCDETGRMYDHPDLAVAGLDGPNAVPIPRSMLISVPRGSDFMVLPGRKPVGINPHSGQSVVMPEFEGKAAYAASVFMAPAYMQTYRAAFTTETDAAVLPLYAYTALGYEDDQFFAAGVRIDEDPRQDPWRFDMAQVNAAVERVGGELAGNRVAQQLIKCAQVYGCRAAQNFFLGRWEAPLPTSIACNSACTGCLSLQKDGTFKASHDRLQCPPTAEEVAEIALFHIQRVEQAVVSFGQGCEGEPLLMEDLLYNSIRRIRDKTNEGTINLNTNASKPAVVERLIGAGLDSMRVSINSMQENLYGAYYSPKGYTFQDVLHSILIARTRGVFVSLNLLLFPGVTDTKEELTAFERFFTHSGADMIQMRNLNIDPELYLRALPPGAHCQGIGMNVFTETLKDKAPFLRFGYFNPAKESFLP
ncbi:MAG: radical SAM protein [Candidatus Latescibacterota bacterium]